MSAPRAVSSRTTVQLYCRVDSLLCLTFYYTATFVELSEIFYFIISTKNDVIFNVKNTISKISIPLSVMWWLNSVSLWKFMCWCRIFFRQWDLAVRWSTSLVPRWRLMQRCVSSCLYLHSTEIYSLFSPSAPNISSRRHFELAMYFWVSTLLLTSFLLDSLFEKLSPKTSDA